MTIHRRGLITGLCGLIAAPAIVRAENITILRGIRLHSQPLFTQIHSELQPDYLRMVDYFERNACRTFKVIGKNIVEILDTNGKWRPYEVGEVAPSNGYPP